MIYKIKFNGMRIKVRKQTQDEAISEFAITVTGVDDMEFNPHADYGRVMFLTRCAGEHVSEHPNRVYYEVVSEAHRNKSILD